TRPPGTRPVRRSPDASPLARASATPLRAQFFGCGSSDLPLTLSLVFRAVSLTAWPTLRAPCATAWPAFFESALIASRAGLVIAVPIVTSFGQTAPNASRPAADLGTADPLCAGRLGPARFRAGVRLLRLRRAGGARARRLTRASRGGADLARAVRARRLLGADRAAHADRDERLARLHVHLRDARSQEPPRGSVAGAAARFPAVGADPELLDHPPVLPAAHARARGRRGNGR